MVIFTHLFTIKPYLQPSLSSTNHHHHLPPPTPTPPIFVTIATAGMTTNSGTIFTAVGITNKFGTIFIAAAGNPGSWPRSPSSYKTSLDLVL
ncbi:hypothetical protein Hanom_Chr06g00547701 [Helianthus anomalus]